jgi:hypothetical protein
LVAPFFIDIQAAAEPFLLVKQALRPEGFREWNEFGSPPGAPGKTKLNLSRKQHELVGWLISMHLLSALEWSVLVDFEATFQHDKQLSQKYLPPPVQLQDQSRKWSSLFHGVAQHGGDKWMVPPIHCRTSYESSVPSNLHGLVSGTVGDDGVDILLPKGPMFYTNGWVLDMDSTIKREKQLLQKWNNLGFQDWDKVYRGVPASGTLSIFVPIQQQKSNQPISDLLEVLVVCGSELLNAAQECSLSRDVNFTVGGFRTTVDLIETEAVSYQRKSDCVLVEIPAEAIVSKRNKRQHAHRRTRHKTVAGREEYHYGVSLELQVANPKVTVDRGPCSFSHVVWQDRLLLITRE